MRRAKPGRKSISDPLRIESVPVSTRALAVLRVGDPFPPEGAIAFLDPGDSTDEEVSRYELAARQAGAARVRVLPRAPSSTDLPEGALEALPEASRSLREVALELVDSVDVDVREEVRVIVEACLTEAGL